MDMSSIPNVAQVKDNFAVFVAGGAFGLFGFWLLRTMGTPVWEAVKKIGYRIWDQVKSLVSKLKFW